MYNVYNIYIQPAAEPWGWLWGKICMKRDLQMSTPCTWCIYLRTYSRSIFWNRCYMFMFCGYVMINDFDILEDTICEYGSIMWL